jgi:hypothetical protein
MAIISPNTSTDVHRKHVILIFGCIDVRPEKLLKDRPRYRSGFFLGAFFEEERSSKTSPPP